MIELSKRKDLIRHHSYFKPLNEAEIEELAELSFEKTYHPNETIINEGEIVDSVYLIAEGDIELDLIGDQPDNILQYVLHPGDAIGLTNEGFFSQTGLRTATLISITDVVLIGWAIDIFNYFLKKHPKFLATRKEASEKMLRMFFIKQAEPFLDLPSENIEKLAQDIQEILVPKGTVLFNKGDEADTCYLICSGAVEIYNVDNDSREKILAVYHPWRLIGESVLFTVAKRYSSARMAESGKLLILKREQLHELMKHNNTAESIIGLIIERCCPTRVPDIEYFHRKGDEGQAIIILKDKRRGQYYQLSEEGWFVWQNIDGHNNLQDLTTLLYKERQIFAPLAVADTILNLSDAGFLILPDIHIPEHNHSQKQITKFQKFKEKLYQWRYLQNIFYNIDSKLSSTYHQTVHLLYTKLGQIILAIIALLGVISFGYQLHTFNTNSIDLTHCFLFVSALLTTNILSAIPHELAHGYTTKYFNHEVNRAGIIFYWLGITAFVDTSDMWLSNPRSRIIVSLAGPYMDIVLGGIFSILAFTVSSPTLDLFFLLLALLLYYSVFKNLNPLQETDGYYIIKDICRDPHLRLNAYQWIKNHGVRALLSSRKEHRCEFFYWLICALFQMLTLILAFAAAHYLRLLLPPTVIGISTFHLLWLLPTLAILKFIFTASRLEL
ncbi:MAG: cyclic nucleotide-binding domain-containing protein [Gammaproteobacteria bacterium]|nr:cyclic nucleotide-binding domain-containing protein [Gammaproteobacteria bacterium]